MKRENMIERVADALVELAPRQEDLIVDAFLVDGRPPFMVALSPQEKLDRYNDPAARQMAIQNAVNLGGPDAEAKYYAEMSKLAARMGNTERSLNQVSGNTK